MKPYFAGSDPLSRTERTCIATAIKGISGDGAPTSGVLQYVGRGTATTLAIAPR